MTSVEGGSSFRSLSLPQNSPIPVPISTPIIVALEFASIKVGEYNNMESSQNLRIDMKISTGPVVRLRVIVPKGVIDST